jgi:hypothetical protein
LAEAADEDEDEEDSGVSEDGALLWQWFGELDRGRSYGEFGPNPLSWADIHQWAALFGNRPTPFELETLKSMDIAFLNAKAKSQKAKA